MAELEPLRPKEQRGPHKSAATSEKPALSFSTRFKENGKIPYALDPNKSSDSKGPKPVRLFFSKEA